MGRRRGGIAAHPPVPDALQRVSVAAQSRDPEKPSTRGNMGPGSAAHRQGDAALRPGHETVISAEHETVISAEEERWVTLR